MLVTLINSKTSSCHLRFFLCPSPQTLPHLPSFPHTEKDCFPFTAWSPRATPAAGCERRVCVTVCA